MIFISFRNKYTVWNKINFIYYIYCKKLVNVINIITKLTLFIYYIYCKKLINIERVRVFGPPILRAGDFEKVNNFGFSV